MLVRITFGAVLTSLALVAVGAAAERTEAGAAAEAAVQTHGGSISAEHGIGMLKREVLAQTQSPVARQLMHAIKAALDPRGTMNPGRVL